MGHLRVSETHESRSSSVSYLLRWSYQNSRQIVIYAILAVAVISVLLAYLYWQGKKSVQLMVDGKAVAAQTRQYSVGDFLKEKGIALSLGDQVTPALSSELQDGQQIVINHAIPVTIISDGSTKGHLTTASTVGSAILNAGLSVSSLDKVYPALDSEVTPDMKIRIVRVSKVMVQQSEVLPYQVMKTADPTIFKGKSFVVQNGAIGQVIHTVEKVFQDGKLVSKRWMGKSVAKSATAQVVAVGTKSRPVPKTEVLAASITRTPNVVNLSGNDKVLKNGISFKYKKVLKNVSMTAYAGEEEGIGTRTASGTRVTEGRTIAVDKNVIPLGWWVYIEGVGFRRAEDTGGAIKGNRIDVYYNSLRAANNFGRKNGRTVYVIGPVKPELN